MKEGDKRCGRKMLPVASIELDRFTHSQGWDRREGGFGSCLGTQIKWPCSPP